MGKTKSRKGSRKPFQVSVAGELLRLNRSTGQGYFLLPDPERGGCKTPNRIGLPGCVVVVS